MDISFFDSEVWAFLVIIALLLAAMMVAYAMKRTIPRVRQSLIPPSVLGGLFLLAASTIFKLITGKYMFETGIFLKGFQTSGNATLEIITYHCLAIGFVSMTLRTTDKKIGGRRAVEVFNTGVTTVATYLLQAILGMGITIPAVMIATDSGLIPAAGVLLAFGFGQGTGQALNFGKIYEAERGFAGGASFGLTVAAIGFLTSTIVGVAYLNYLRRKGRLTGVNVGRVEQTIVEDEGDNESMDTFTVQVALILIVYVIAYAIINLLSRLLPGLQHTFFGFNFLLAVLVAIPVKAIVNLIQKRVGGERKIISNYLMNRIGGFAFDLMIVAGIAAIRIDLITNYWLVLLLMFIFGAVFSFAYLHIVCKKLFPEYEIEQFMAMFGMLTGTASTGIILLREIDRDLRTPASENLVYQNLPAIVFGFPILLLANYAPLGMKQSIVTLGLCMLFFVVMNVILFRRALFGRKKGSD